MSKSIYSYSAKNVGDGFNNFVESNDFSRREADLGNVEDLEKPLEDVPKSKKKFEFPFIGSTSTTQYLDLTHRQRKRQPQEPHQQFVGIGDFIDDDADRIINNIPKNEEQQSKAASFRQDVEDLTAEKHYAFKQSLHNGEFRIREGHQRVATIKQSGSMTWSKGDVAGPDIQDYVALLCKHKLAHQTKPVGLTVNEKLIKGEDERIAFFRNTITTLLANDIDFERIKIHNKEYRYLLDEFAPKKVADVGLENGKQERVEPKLEDGLTKAPEAQFAGVGDATNDFIKPDAPSAAPVAKGEMIFSNSPEPDLSLAAANDNTSIVLKKADVVEDVPAPDAPVVEAQKPAEVVKEEVVETSIKEGKELTSSVEEVKDQAIKATEPDDDFEDFRVSADKDIEIEPVGFVQKVDSFDMTVDDFLNDDVSFDDVFGGVTRDDPIFEPDFHAPPENKTEQPKAETVAEKPAVEKCALVTNKDKISEMFKDEDINTEIRKTHKQKFRP
ncbi:hypothetical protein [Pseudomonas sp. FSL R10-2398]|uniref:hypothetical protein n=1 Tax=Pseudomonas sp. FSL R10-2398 TaxID=2662201 RepID=UPI001294B1AC|nr:hypothetical protein [Pseudomonas sp. FSL R10-2398]MQT50896.1 hypothetical protein [Pseudomonas sp. FSL R10-2398]